MTEIKKCVCGGEPKLMHGPGDYWVECTKCHAMSEMHTMDERSIAEWNEMVEEHKPFKCPYSETIVWCDRRDENGDNIVCDSCPVILRGE